MEIFISNVSTGAFYLCIFVAIVTAQSQNFTRIENPTIIPRQPPSFSNQRLGNGLSQQLTGNNARRDGILSQQRRINDASPGGIGTASQHRRISDRRGFLPQQQRINEGQLGSTGTRQIRVIERQFRGNDAQRGRISTQQLRGNERPRVGNDVQRSGITSQQLRGNDAQRRGVVSQPVRGNVAQRGGIVSRPMRGNDAQRGGIISQPVRGNDAQRGSVIQLRRPIAQRRPITNLQNLPRTSGAIPRARSFQESLPNTRPRLDPRTGIMTRGTRARNQPTIRIISGSRLPRRGIDTTSMCASPRSVRCYSWPRNRDIREAYVCDGGCLGRACSVPCECSCVDPRIIGRLRAIGRISGPELILTDTRLSNMPRRQRQGSQIIGVRPTGQRQLPTSPSAASSDRSVRSNELPQRDPNVDLNFGISDDVLATLIAQPVLNEIVGPQGINQIIAGEPPALLTRADRGQGSLPPSVTNEIPQPDMRAIRTSPPRAQARTELPVPNRSMGIPVPLSRINFNPGTSTNPSMGNMQVIMSEIRPFTDPTTGINIDLPNPTPMDMNMPPAGESQVSVRQLPGTNVLFVDLTRSPSRNAGQRRILPNNMTVSDLRSRTGNNVLLSNSVQNTNQTLPGSIGSAGNVRMFQGGTVQTTDSRGRLPTQDQCLAQRMELWCDPLEPWDGTPGLSRWCLLNCRADNCDNQRCACACIDEILFKTNYEQLSLRAP